MTKSLLEYLFLIGLALGIVAILILLAGCQVLKPELSGSGGGTIPSTLPRVPSWSFMPSLLLVGLVMGIVGAGLGFVKLGGISAAACMAGLVVWNSMNLPWFQVSVGLILLASVIIVIVGIVRKNKAIRELIIGAQFLKKSAADYFEGGTKALQAQQSKETQKIVQEVKGKLKLKGTI